MRSVEKATVWHCTCPVSSLMTGWLVNDFLTLGEEEKKTRDVGTNLSLLAPPGPREGPFADLSCSADLCTCYQPLLRLLRHATTLTLHFQFFPLSFKCLFAPLPPRLNYKTLASFDQVRLRQTCPRLCARVSLVGGSRMAPRQESGMRMVKVVAER